MVPTYLITDTALIAAACLALVRSTGGNPHARKRRMREAAKRSFKRAAE